MALILSQHVKILEWPRTTRCCATLLIMVDRPALDSLPAPDPVIEAYKRDVDRTLLRENLKLTPGERLRKLQSFVDAILASRSARTPRGGRA